MEQILYAKYSNERDYKFQLVTEIIQNKDKKIVRKRALNQEAYSHIDYIANIFENLNSYCKGSNFCINRCQLINEKLEFEYLQGDTLSEILNNYLEVGNYSVVDNIIVNYLNDLINLPHKNYFKKTEEFVKVFGDVQLQEDLLSYNLCNIDATFFNVIPKKNFWFVFDYEWTFEFPIPVNYLLYRILYYFFRDKDQKVLHKLKNFYSLYGIDETQKSIFFEMEKNFQAYIKGNVLNTNELYQTLLHENVVQNYPLKNISLDSLLLNKEKRILQLQEEELERNQHIEKLDSELDFARKEVERLNQHIEELSAWGQGLDKENSITKRQIFDLEDKIIESNKQLNVANSIMAEQKNRNASLERQLDMIQTEFNNKVGHIELLLDSERKLQQQVVEKENELNAIHQSNGWKVLVRCYKMRDFLLPKGSKRRFVMKLGKKFLKKPKVYLQKLNWQNVKKLRYYASTEGMDNLSSRLDAFDDKYNNVQEEKFEAQPVQEQEVYDVLEFPAVEQPLVSIIIPVYNQFHYTYACLKSILENTQDVSYEIIIADDVSNDKTVDIQTIVNNIIVVRNEKNLRFLLNCNHAAKYAKGKYIHFLNNDTQVQAGWLSSLVQLIESDEKIGMVGSKLVYPDGRLQEAGGILWNDGSAWNYGNGADPAAPEYNYVKDADYISGASIMLSKALWNELGGFDEYFAPAYCEDSDLAFSVRKAGYRVVYQPKSVVVHFEGVSNGKDVSSGLKAYQVENGKKLYDKWRNVLQTEHFNNAENVFIARDKSKNKKCILIVDHYVPHYDKDAGSKTVYQYVKMFCSMGYNVKFIGDNFYPHEPYTTALEQLGVEVLYGSYYANHWKEWIKANGKFIAFVFLNRPHIAVNYIDYIRENTNAKIVYYGHDLHFLREMREYQLTGNEALKQSSEDWKKKELQLMRKADLSYYPSEVEVTEIHKIDKEIKVRAIPAYIYEKVETWNYTAVQRQDLMFIGGFGHRPNIDAVLWLYQEIWSLVKKKNEQIKIYILGSNPPEEIKQLNQEDFVIKGFVSDEELLDFYTKCRISIVPLRYGAGIKGKVVEAMHYQLPVITTSIGAEGLDETGKTLCIADEAEAFAQKIIELYEDHSKLADYSKQAWQYVNETFTVEAAKKIIEHDF